MHAMSNNAFGCIHYRAEFPVCQTLLPFRYKIQLLFKWCVSPPIKLSDKMCTVFLNSKYGTTKIIWLNVYFLLFHYLNFPLIVLLHFTSLLHDYTDLKPACKHDLPHFSFMSLANPISPPLTNIQSPLTWWIFFTNPIFEEKLLDPWQFHCENISSLKHFFSIQICPKMCLPSSHH